MENELTKLTERVLRIEERNKSVELDKAWERSFSRRILLFVLTYIVIALYLRAIGVFRPWINAIVPAVGFVISTLSVPFLKKYWMRNKK